MLNQLNKLGAHVSAFVISFGTAMGMSAAYAEGDINAVIEKSTDQITGIANMVNVACYGGGAVLAGTGLLNFKKHVDEPGQNPLRKAIGPGAAGVALLAFPSVTGILQASTATGEGSAVGYEGGFEVSQ